MATPIIKIRRGSGVPTIAGITFGEFAYDRVSGTLYLGITGGGYTTFAPYGKNSNTIPINIPIGMQISNDGEFGGLVTPPTLNDSIGYSENTVPTTYAVRQFVSQAIVKGQSGITLNPGQGIQFVYADSSDPTRGITINNTGVLVGYTAFEVMGNISGSPTRVSPLTGKDLFYYNAQSGINMSFGKSGPHDVLNIQNIGVTGINGVTGNITSFSPFVLPGFTNAVGLAEGSNIDSILPIGINRTDGGAKLQFIHATSGAVAGTYGNASTFAIPTIQINSTGHVIDVTSQIMSFGPNSIPAGLTETVQDIIFNSIDAINGLGITYYDNNTPSVAILYNTGIRNLGINGLATPGNGPGLCGDVKLVAGPGVVLDYANIGSGVCGIRINNSTNNFSRITVGKGSVLGSGTIYDKGVTGSGNQVAEADQLADTLEIYAGRGIGISAGSRDNSNNDALLIWNTGINSFSLLDNAGNAVTDGTGISGDVQLQAGSNISFTVNAGQNRISIASSGGGSGTGSLVGDYLTTYGTDLRNEYNGAGVTGNIQVIGNDGILTVQTDTTNNGNLNIGLSSKLVLPARKFIGFESNPSDPDYNSSEQAALIRIPTTIETTGSKDQWGGVLPAIIPIQPGNPINAGISGPRNRIEVESIVSGVTGTISAGGVGPYSPVNIDPSVNTTVPGKVLRLVATSGYWATGVGSGVSTQYPQAELRLLGYPSSEHLGAELERVRVNLGGGSDAQTHPCKNNTAGGGTCKGMPPALPQCVTYIDPSLPTVDAVNYNTYYTGSAERPTAKFSANIVTTESAFIEGDIWLKGNLLNATSGCLLIDPNNPPGGNNGGSICIECLGDGNVGITGSARIDKDLIVYGATAIFYGGTFAVDNNFIIIGGLSGDLLQASPNLNSHKSDRGFLIHNKRLGTETPRRSFIGQTNEGIFRYIPDATYSINPNGVETFTGAPGDAHFLTINGVGITNDSGAAAGKARIKVGGTTDAIIGGSVTLQSAATSTRSTINFENGSQVINIGQNANRIEFARGITFDVTTTTTNFSGAANVLKLQWATETTAAGGRVVYIPTPPAGGFTELVTVGRSRNADSATSGTITELSQQILYNKTLADNTIIDCGTY